MTGSHTHTHARTHTYALARAIARTRTRTGSLAQACARTHGHTHSATYSAIYSALTVRSTSGPLSDGCCSAHRRAAEAPTYFPRAFFHSATQSTRARRSECNGIEATLAHSLRSECCECSQPRSAAAGTSGSTSTTTRSTTHAGRSTSLYAAPWCRCHAELQTHAHSPTAFIGAPPHQPAQTRLSVQRSAAVPKPCNATQRPQGGAQTLRPTRHVSPPAAPRRDGERARRFRAPKDIRFAALTDGLSAGAAVYRCSGSSRSRGSSRTS
jgi:hypothetical protein